MATIDSTTHVPSTSTITTDYKKHNPTDSTHPVLVPSAPELFYDNDQFQTYLHKTFHGKPSGDTRMDIDDDDDSPSPAAIALNEDTTSGENKTYTTNGAKAFKSTMSPLLDLFTKLGKMEPPNSLRKELDKAWKADPLATLKIIWHLRSIHLGMGGKEGFYQCLGWLKEAHPVTLLTNLESLVRPVIEKKLPTIAKRDAAAAGLDVGGETVVVSKYDLEDELRRWEVGNGVSHGYYCDLLNILLLALAGTLDCEANPSSTLTNKPPKATRTRKKSEKHIHTGTPAKNPPKKPVFGPKRLARIKVAKEEAAKKRIEHCHQEKKAAKAIRHKQENELHEIFLKKFNEDAFYRSLHMQVARIFATALKRDTELLGTGKQSAIKRISLAAKWAPSLEKMHDRRAFIASTIAEIMFENTDNLPRENYLKIARDHYRRRVSSLRKALGVVERCISANSFKDIKYNRVPSIAMDRYKSMFAKKDMAHFESYIEDVAQGKVKISGAVLMPALLVRQAQALKTSVPQVQPSEGGEKNINIAAIVKEKMNTIQRKVLDGQWKTLVQRIKDSGTLANSIAVCDVSGSMTGVTFRDGTNPIHSALGLSLLVAEVAGPPWNNKIITFSSTPEMLSIDSSTDFAGKLKKISASEWGFNTNFNSVFEKLILPLAIENKLQSEDVIKKVFVFSDMQFDEAEMPFNPNNTRKNDKTRWETNFQRIKRIYQKHGYELPEIVFWNLAGEPTPKPVTRDTIGTSIVSGYSQALIKSFLDKGELEGPEEEESDEEDLMEIGEDGEVEKVSVPKEKNPLSFLEKIISHKAYGMLKVFD